MELNTNSPEFRAVVNEIVSYIEKKPKKKWLEVQEVEEIYSIKRSQLFELKRQKKIKCKPISTKLLFSVASLDKFMESI